MCNANGSLCEAAEGGTPRNDEQGVVLISTFIVMVTLTAIVAGFLWMTSVGTLGVGSGIPSSKALWLAEAGNQKAIWNLKTPTGSGGQGETWTTTGTTESLGDGSYTMVVSRYDFCLSANGSSASASSEVAPNVAANAIDGDDTTYWESQRIPTPANPEDLTITFPYPLTLNKVRFLVPTGSVRVPRNYKWQVSTDGTTYTTVVDVANNATADRTDTFSAASNVNYLRLLVEGSGPLTGGVGGQPLSLAVTIATLEAIGSKITSTGTVGGLSRKVEQTVVADDGSPQNQVAYDQIDWTEIVPA